MSDVSVSTLHPVPVILKEALGRALGSELKRGGKSRIEGAGWNREKAGTHRRGALYPACTCSVPKWPIPALFPPFTPASSHPSRLWVVAPLHPKAKSGPRRRGGVGTRALRPPSCGPALLPAPPPPGPAGRRRGVRAGTRTEGDARAAASLRWSRQAEAVAADPRGLTVGGERNAGARRASPDKCFCTRPRRLPERRVHGMRAAAAAVPGGPERR